MDSYKSLDDELIEQFEISELYKDEELDRETLKEIEIVLRKDNYKENYHRKIFKIILILKPDKFWQI